jgi:iron complex outermembrane receptor protein
MNGVVNVITRSAERTSRGFLDAADGSLRRRGTVRYGAATAADAWLRCYGDAFHEDGLRRADGADAGDGWSKAQAGCRFDSMLEAGQLTIQGDTYRGSENQPEGPDGLVTGGNVLARMQRHGVRSDWQLELSITGTDLLHRSHIETPGGDQIPSAILGEARWRF